MLHFTDADGYNALSYTCCSLQQNYHVGILNDKGVTEILDTEENDDKKYELIKRVKRAKGLVMTKEAVKEPMIKNYLAAYFKEGPTPTFEEVMEVYRRFDAAHLSDGELKKIIQDSGIKMRQF